ncbi:PREDICTED: uncharacterized protein LOC109115249 [Nelumbo nucifera]|uniref:Uncharacterized protein LOC109115249 n=1 Tax=Nelumbo nucifera TaxID=4432 RepID=A0A1U8Q958_NELNU|nr:PREDICTED: uncharacterized protein LOC109115249 [Nelumbo nucifera]
MFYGGDPIPWILKAEKYFEYHDIQGLQRMTIASFHLEGEVILRFQWFRHSRPQISWQEFTEALCIRFGPTVYDDYDEMLSRVKQKGTVRDYQVEFERLATRVYGWPEKALVGCFVGGLRDDIKVEVKALQPNSLSAAAGLARLQEE